MKFATVLPAPLVEAGSPPIYGNNLASKHVEMTSLPYFYAHEGDNTFFRHIDSNIRDLASSGHSANMIQGTVSLDDEKPDDYTMVLPGMHKHIKEWDETLTARGLSLGALVHRI